MCTGIAKNDEVDAMEDFIDSVICVHIISMCDKKYECPHGDDEHLCLQQIPDCPESCVCSFFSLFCNNWRLPEETNDKHLQFIYVTILKSNITDLSALFHQFNQTIEFDIESSMLTTSAKH